MNISWPLVVVIVSVLGVGVGAQWLCVRRITRHLDSAAKHADDAKAACERLISMLRQAADSMDATTKEGK